MERNTQDTVEQMIFSEIHEKWYTLEGKAPIAMGNYSTSWDTQLTHQHQKLS